MVGLLLVVIPLYGGNRWEIYGDDFFNRGEFYRAITMYHLALFDYEGKGDRCRVLVKSAEAFIKAGFFEKALTEYDESERYCRLEKVLYLKGRLFFLRGNYGMAADVWGKLDGERYRFLEGVSLVLSGDETGWKLLKEAADELKLSGREEIFKLEQVTIPHRSPVVAAVLSALIPGAGQVYTGHYGEAGMSLAINSLFAFLVWQSIKKAERIPGYGYTETGVWAFLGMGFYLGNIYGAALSARQFNQYEENLFREKFISTLHGIGFSLDLEF